MPYIYRRRFCWFVCCSLGFLLFSAGVFADQQYPQGHGSSEKFFQRIAFFPAYLNTAVDRPSGSEIVDVAQDGNTLIYTDGVGGRVGFVDITDPARPGALGTIDVDGEPTSVAVAGKHALVVVDKSAGFLDPAGQLWVVDIENRRVPIVIDLGGQPDAVAVSPDRRYAAIVIENQRDENFQGGAMPQGPSGFLVIVDLSGNPEQWRLRRVDLTGIAFPYPGDAEPEYVAINERNIAVVTLQENNYLVLIDLPSGRIVDHFSAGAVDLFDIDIREEQPAQISLAGSQPGRVREPDGVAWLNNRLFVTANEGDLEGGSRDFSVFDDRGRDVFSAGNALEHQAVRLGHYPDGRSENKGIEPENVAVGRYGNDSFLFVTSERANVVFVYRVKQGGRTFELHQTLPAGVGPEGVKAIPERGLLIAASEVDRREAGIRGGLTVYRLEEKAAAYPTVLSANREDGTPIPWGALSGLSTDPYEAHTAYAVHDGFFGRSRIYKLDTGRKPAIINAEIVLTDSRGKLAAADPRLVNADHTVNLDPEGISNSAEGGFWIASEGDGSADGRNLLLHAGPTGDIDEVVGLPDATNARQTAFGFQGVTSVGAGNEETLFVVFQREWKNDPANHVRIGRYRRSTGDWSFYYYPLDPAESPQGGWVGLSEIMALGEHQFAVIERDDQAGADARIKRLYRFGVEGLEAQPEDGAGFPVLDKTLVADLLPALKAAGGRVLEKIEGMTVTENGDVLIVNDNDGVDGSNGETQLLTLPHLIH